jgi:hypothetical protein
MAGGNGELMGNPQGFKRFILNGSKLQLEQNRIENCEYDGPPYKHTTRHIW